MKMFMNIEEKVEYLCEGHLSPRHPRCRNCQADEYNEFCKWYQQAEKVVYVGGEDD